MVFVVMIIKKFKDIDDEIKKLADQFIVRRLIETGRYGIAVTRDGKTFYVYDDRTKTFIYSTKKLSEAIEYLKSKLGEGGNEQ